jgi:PPOX class probable FMN-dependent enzyme
MIMASGVADNSPERGDSRAVSRLASAGSAEWLYRVVPDGTGPATVGRSEATGPRKSAYGRDGAMSWRSGDYAEVGSAAELRALLGGEPSQRSATKDRARLHEKDREWLAASPFCVLATSAADGTCDASPKGDPAGSLIHVLDDATIAVPERPGNRRADGYLNVLSNPHVGIISLIPGRNETLRINGRARLLRDGPFFDELAVRGTRPILALLVEVEQVFFHCPKSFMRSGLWQPETWRPDVLPTHATLVKAVQDTPETLPELEEYYAPENYSARLY